MKIKRNISMDEALFEQVMDFAKKNGISFSGAVSVLSSMGLDQKKAVDSFSLLPELVKMSQKKLENQLEPGKTV